MTDVLFIEPELVKQLTNISDNIEGKLIGPAIREAGNALRDIVGDALCDKLEELVANEEINLDENLNYKQLLDKSQYFLAYTTAANVTILTAAKIDNFGVSRSTDEHIESLSLSDVFTISKHYQNIADDYCHKLQSWILKNKKKWPELTENSCNDIRANLYSAASCGIWLGGTRGKKTR